MKRIVNIILLTFLAITFVSAQNLVDVDFNAGTVSEKELTVGEFNDVSLSIKSEYIPDTRTISVEIENTGIDRTLWFAYRQMPYDDFKKDAESIWETTQFKNENQIIYAYINTGNATHAYGNVVMLLPEQSFTFSINNVDEAIDKLNAILTFYVSVDESKGNLFGKKKRKMEQRIVVEYNIKFPVKKEPEQEQEPEISCEKYDFSGYLSFLQMKELELEEIKQTTATLSKTQKDKQRDDINEQVNTIKEEIEATKPPCPLNKKVNDKLKLIDNKSKEIAKLFKAKPPTEKTTTTDKKNRRTDDNVNIPPPLPPSPDCSASIQKIKGLTDQARGLYIKIRQARSEGSDLSKYKGQLNGLKSQAASASGGSQCSGKTQSAMTEFNREYNAALKELNK